MSDQYDGWIIYRFNRTSQPAYEVRGNKIYECGDLSLALFEIHGDHIHACMPLSNPIMEIRLGRYIHEYMSSHPPLYELRKCAPDVADAIQTNIVCQSN